MTRRSFWTTALATATAAATAHGADTLPVLVHEFKTCWDTWISSYVEFRETVGESPVAELRQWGKVRGTFHEVDLAVRNE